MDWDHKDLWRKRGKDFLIEVSRHAVHLDQVGIAHSEGPHRWAVYAYIYPGHPLFGAFDAEKDMLQRATYDLPLHGGPSYFYAHRSANGTITSFQVGADYNHLHDEAFCRMATPDEAATVFYDAGCLYDWLASKGSI